VNKTDGDEERTILKTSTYSREKWTVESLTSATVEQRRTSTPSMLAFPNIVGCRPNESDDEIMTFWGSFGNDGIEFKLGAAVCTVIRPIRVANSVGVFNCFTCKARLGISINWHQLELHEQIETTWANEDPNNLGNCILQNMFETPTCDVAEELICNSILSWRRQALSGGPNRAQCLSVVVLF